MQSSQPVEGAVLHQQLVDYLKTQGLIKSAQVEEAFRAVPRHFFLPGVELEEVYRDQPVMTKKVDGQFVSSSSQPAIMAIMLEQLQLQPGQRVLEIGAGTGYNAVLLAHIVGESGHVVTIDIDEDIVEAAREHIAQAGYAERITVLCADGALGYAAEGPYDRIILTVNASDIAPAWWEQLKPDGLLLLPLVLRGPQLSVVFQRQGDHMVSISQTYCGFVNMRGMLAEQTQFQLESVVDGKITLVVGEPHAVAIDQVYGWLLEPAQERSTGLEITSGDIFRGLGFWLALHSPLTCYLGAEGVLFRQEPVPPLMMFFSRRVSSHLTIGLLLQYPQSGSSNQEQSAGAKLQSGYQIHPNRSSDFVPGDGGLCLLAREPGTPIPEDALAASLPFRLFLRGYGPGAVNVMERTQELIEGWAKAGRPDASSLSIKAYPQDREYSPALGEQVIMKTWTRIVCRWQ